MKLYFVCFVVCIVCLGQGIQAQGYIYDSLAYHRVPLVVPLYRGGFAKLPPSYSLRQYCPTPQNQGERGDCVGWAVAYAARTILAAQQLAWQKDDIEQKAFSAAFIYDQVKPVNDSMCRAGASLPAALQVLKETGALPRYLYGDSCHQQTIPRSWLLMAEENRLTHYARLFDSHAPDKVLYIKRSLAAGNPVVVGIRCCSASFLYPEDVYWRPQPHERYNQGNVNLYGGHALTIVGYDDYRYGGAFEVMNSWGSQWGNEGFLWIGYEDMERICIEAFELSMLDTQRPIEGSLLLDYAGFILQDRFYAFTAPDEGWFWVQQPSTTYPNKLKLVLELSAPAYVYLLAVTGTKVTPIFPSSVQESSLVSYTTTTLQLPTVQNGDPIDLLIMLISHEALHMPSICSLLSGKNTLQELKKLLQVISMSAIRQAKEGGRIVFRQRNPTQRGVLSLMLQLK